MSASSDQDFEYIENQVPFTCPICLAEISPGDGIVLKNCSHTFCKSCITKVIQHSPDPEISCPFVTVDNQKCEAFIQDRELRCFITEEDYIKHLSKSLSQAEVSIKQSFHCRKPNCIGWVEIVGRNVKTFKCPVCMSINCISCRAVHSGISCADFKTRNLTSGQKSNFYIKKLIRERKLMKCPKCGILVEKTRGCNHLKCTKCQHDFQWIGKSGFEWVR